MIVEYTPEGLITHVVRDPVPEGLFEVLEANNVIYANFPPIVEKETDEEGVEHTKSITYTELDLQTDYIKLPEKVVAKRPIFNFPAEIVMTVGNSYTLSDIPAGTKLWMDGQEIEIEGETLELDGDMPAEYSMVFINGVYIIHRMKVSVHET